MVVGLRRFVSDGDGAVLEYVDAGERVDRLHAGAVERGRAVERFDGDSEELEDECARGAGLADDRRGCLVRFVRLHVGHGQRGDRSDGDGDARLVIRVDDGDGDADFGADAAERGGGGDSETVLPQLTGPAAAGGALVSLTSSNSSLAPLPKSVLIPAGSYSSAVTAETITIS